MRAHANLTTVPTTLLLTLLRNQNGAFSIFETLLTNPIMSNRLLKTPLFIKTLCTIIPLEPCADNPSNTIAPYFEALFSTQHGLNLFHKKILGSQRARQALLNESTIVNVLFSSIQKNTTCEIIEHNYHAPKIISLLLTMMNTPAIALFLEAIFTLPAFQENQERYGKELAETICSTFYYSSIIDGQRSLLSPVICALLSCGSGQQLLQHFRQHVPAFSTTLYEHFKVQTYKKRYTLLPDHQGQTLLRDSGRKHSRRTRVA